MKRESLRTFDTLECRVAFLEVPSCFICDIIHLTTATAGFPTRSALPKAALPDNF